jgi:hypothetical protein
MIPRFAYDLLLLLLLLLQLPRRVQSRRCPLIELEQSCQRWMSMCCNVEALRQRKETWQVTPIESIGQSVESAAAALQKVTDGPAAVRYLADFLTGMAATPGRAE